MWFHNKNISGLISAGIYSLHVLFIHGWGFFLGAQVLSCNQITFMFSSDLNKPTLLQQRWITTVLFSVFLSACVCSPDWSLNICVDFIFFNQTFCLYRGGFIMKDTSKQSNWGFLHHLLLFWTWMHLIAWRLHHRLDVEMGKWARCVISKWEISVFLFLVHWNVLLLIAQRTKMQLRVYFDYPVVEPFSCVKWIKKNSFSRGQSQKKKDHVLFCFLLSQTSINSEIEFNEQAAKNVSLLKPKSNVYLWIGKYIKCHFHFQLYFYD